MKKEKTLIYFKIKMLNKPTMDELLDSDSMALTFEEYLIIVKAINRVRDRRLKRLDKKYNDKM